MYKKTNIEIDVNLVNEAMQVTHLKTVKDVVNHSLREIVRLNKQKDLLKLKGKIKWEGSLEEMRKND
ncbi:MAG TPA: type II toxin-antitoxin system VapB family antitoxin [Bacteroidales bacterium]|nr:type II toxin-antitoxin system VapB family antitoxin [Bacteroidales bacterium]